MVGRVALRARGGGARHLCARDRRAARAGRTRTSARARDRARAVHAQLQPRLRGGSARRLGAGRGGVRADVRPQRAPRLGVSGAAADGAVPGGLGRGRGRGGMHVPRSARAVAGRPDRAGAGNGRRVVRVHRQCRAGGTARAAAAVPGAARDRARLWRHDRLRGGVGQRGAAGVQLSRRNMLPVSPSWGSSRRCSRSCSIIR